MNLDTNTSLAVMQSSQANAGAKANDMTRAAQDKNLAKLDAAAKDFEAMFITQMLQPMFEGIEVNSRFGGGKGEEIFRGFMLEEYGKMIAESGQLGIADAVKQQLIEMQSQNSQNSDIN